MVGQMKTSKKIYTIAHGTILLGFPSIYLYVMFCKYILSEEHFIVLNLGKILLKYFF